MKNTKLIALSVAVALGFMGAAQASTSCAEKKAALEYQIQQAKAYGNYHKVISLQKALDKVNTYCTTSSMAANVQKKIAKIEDKIADKQDDVIDIKSDLAKAKAKGDAKKVKKYQVKLSEKQGDIAELRAELAQLKAELAAIN